MYPDVEAAMVRTAAAGWLVAGSLPLLSQNGYGILDLELNPTHQ